jgi:opacity protein-like surface antigen
MRKLLNSISIVFSIIALGSSYGQVQRFDEPLTMQGIDKTAIHSAASRALGGTSVGLSNEIGIMFSNPAALSSLKQFQISIGNSYRFLDESQTQQYGPAKYYPNFSLVMEGLTDLIPDPVLDTVKIHTAKDSVQRPYDKIGPNWSRTKNKNLPLQAMAAIPFKIGSYNAAAGIGAVQYANLNYYYQNNNVLSPAINVQRPYPVKLVTNDSSYLPVKWYQRVRDREGVVYGYGAAFSFSFNENFSLGVSGLLLKGSTDDYESTLGRGRFIFYSSYFRLDSVDYHSSKTGTSDYSGFDLTISGSYKSKYVTLGFAIKPPVTITRDFKYDYKGDSLGVSKAYSVSGTDKMKLPWSGMVGISLSIWDNIRAALEYEIRPMANADYESADGSTTSPWKSSQALRAGVEYMPVNWLVLRAGVRDNSEVFEQEGNPFAGDPVSSTIISAGCGIHYSGLTLNLTYEYGNVKFNDMLQDCVILNKSKGQNIIAEISYNIPLLK